MSETTGTAVPPEAGSDQPAAGTAAPAPDLSGFVPKSQWETTEQQRRSLQAELDRRKAAEKPAPTPPPAAAPLDANAVAAQVWTLLAAKTAVADTLRDAREKFPSARPEVLSADYQTPEEALAAVQASHQSEETYRTSVRAQVEAELAARLEREHGIKVAPTTPQTSDAEGSKTLTAADLKAMSQADFNKVPDEEIQRITRGT